MTSSIILSIDRSKPFDPKTAPFDHKAVAKLNLEIDTRTKQDKRSLCLSEVDLSKISLINILHPGEPWIDGEKRQRRIRIGDDLIRLDPQICQTLIENKDVIPKSWWNLEHKKHAVVISFDGQSLRDREGNKYVVCMYQSKDDWYMNPMQLKHDWLAHEVAAVLSWYKRSCPASQV